MMLTLRPEVEARVMREAVRHGLSPEEYANQIIDERLSEAEQERRGKLIAMLQAWNEEEANDSEGFDDEFFKMLDEDRTSERKLFPPELKGISW